MKTEEFKAKCTEWNELIGAKDLSIQKAIVYQEERELEDAKNDTERKLERADVAWTNIWLSELACKKSLFHLGQSTASEAKRHLKEADATALQAVCESNWTKVRKFKERSPEIPYWVKKSKDALENAKTADGRQRFINLEHKTEGEYHWIVGTDKQDESNPIEGKVLKPHDYKGAKDMYRDLLG